MSQYRPIIGIPCRSDTSGLYPGRPVDAQNVAYSDAVIQSGGIPILLPVFLTGEMLHTLFNQIDGIIFSGGGDIDPTFYDQPPLVENLSDVQIARDEHEIGLMRLAIHQYKPFFAICRGVQVMNVAAGGDLWQDLASQNPDTIRHDFYYHDDQLPRNYIAHEVRLEQESRLRLILQDNCVRVNSLHHQAIRQVAPSLKAVGRAKDGVVEVLEVPDHPFGVGVQWHPEELYAEHIEARKMFDAFIDAARNGHARG